MLVHLTSLSISVELWLIGSSCLEHCIRSHIGLQYLLQVGHIFNVQTALKGQWNEDWWSVLQGEQAGARTVWQPGTCGLPSHQDWWKKMRHRCHFLPFLFHMVCPLKLEFVLILTGKKKKGKEKLIPSCSKVLEVFFFFNYHLHLLNIRLKC